MFLKRTCACNIVRAFNVCRIRIPQMAGTCTRLLKSSIPRLNVQGVEVEVQYSQQGGLCAEISLAAKGVAYELKSTSLLCHWLGDSSLSAMPICHTVVYELRVLREFFSDVSGVD